MNQETETTISARQDWVEAQARLANALERLRAINERTRQISSQLEDSVQRLDESEAVREEILQSMLFDVSAQDALDRYNEDRIRMEREIADLSELKRKALDATKNAQKMVEGAQGTKRACEQKLNHAVFKDRCARIWQLAGEDLEDAALAATAMSSAYGSDRTTQARGWLEDILLPHTLFSPSDARKQEILARILGTP